MLSRRSGLQKSTFRKLPRVETAEHCPSHEGLGDRRQLLLRRAGTGVPGTGPPSEPSPIGTPSAQDPPPNRRVCSLTSQHPAFSVLCRLLRPAHSSHSRKFFWLKKDHQGPFHFSAIFSPIRDAGSFGGGAC